MRILIFGTSSVYGAWDSDGGWSTRLRKFFDKKGFGNQDYFDLFYSLGIDGETTEKLLKRFEKESQVRISSNVDENIIIFDIGKNDSCFLRSKKAKSVGEVEFEQNLTRLADEANKVSKNVVFIGTGVVDEKNPNYKKWIPDYLYTNEALQEYDSIIKKVAKKKGAGYIGISKRLAHYNYTEILDPDGLHLNNKGHKVVFGLVKRYLVKSKLLT